MSKMRELTWQEMSQGNARYQWTMVRKLDKQGVTAPEPYVPRKHNVDLSDIRRAERTFEEALDFCKQHSSREWRKQYGVTNADSAIDRLERALDHIKREKRRLKRDKKHREAKLDDDLALTVVR